MDTMFGNKGKNVRRTLPLLRKRSAEYVAVLAIVSTFFLFLHTKSLTTKLREMETRLQPSAMQSSNEYSGLSSNGATLSHANGHNSKFYPSSDTNAADNELENLYKYYKSTGQMSTLNAYALNNTKFADNQVVVFNRVPKVGSQTFMELLRRLSIRNNFHFHRDQLQRVETIRLAPYQQEELAEMVSDLPTPSVYVKHVCYVNFTRFNLPKPIYVNLVRDPVERVISWFYYIRAPWYYVERKQAFPDLPLPDSQWLRKDFETCVLRGDPECTYKEGETHEGIGDHRRQTLFFCGHDDDCTPFNTQRALDKSKQVVERDYAVVGILEDMNTTLTVFEKYIPRFFAGAREIYYNEIKHFNKINKNNFKPPVTEEVKNIVRQNFTREIEFFKFCKERLQRQYIAANLLDFK